MAHWRTSIIGAIMILGCTCTFLGSWLANGGIPSAEQWSIFGAGLTVGVGFLRSADAKEVSKISDEKAK